MEIQKPEAVLARAPVGTSLRVSFNMLVHLNFQIGQAIDHFRGAIIKKRKILGKIPNFSKMSQSQLFCNYFAILPL